MVHFLMKVSHQLNKKVSTGGGGGGGGGEAPAEVFIIIILSTCQLG